MSKEFNFENNVEYTDHNVLVYLVDQDRCFSFKNYDVLADMNFIGEIVSCERKRYIFDYEMVEYYDRFYKLTDKEIEYIIQNWVIDTLGVDTEIDENFKFIEGKIDKKIRKIREYKEEHLKEYKKAVIEEKHKQYEKYEKKTENSEMNKGFGTLEEIIKHLEKQLGGQVVSVSEIKMKV